MELKVLPLQSGHNSTSINIKTTFNEVFLENIFFGKVVGIGKEEGVYLLYFRGKTIEVKSENLLHLNEHLHLKAVQSEHGMNLEILERSFEKTDSNEATFSNKSLKSIHSLNEILDSYLERSSELEESKFFKILQTFFPVIEWKDQTPWFEWKFGDSKGEGYFGKKGDKKSFYLQIFSVKLGKIVFLMSWEKMDLTDLNIQSYFANERSYLLAYMKRDTIYHYLKNNGVFFQNFSFNYSEPPLFESENIEWIA